LKTLQPLSAPPNSASQLRRLEFTPDNKRLLSAKWADLSGWDIGERQVFTVEHAGEGERLQVFGFSPDANYLIVSWGGYDLTLLDSRTLLLTCTLRCHRGLITGIA